MRPHDRRIGASGRRLEAIAEACFSRVKRRRVGIDVDQLALLQPVAAQIVDAVDVVGMRMRVDHRVDALDVRRQHLLAEIRAGVDDDAGDAAVLATRSTIAAVRVRRFFGLFGSQLPQSPVMRGVPGDEPQPSMVKRSRPGHGQAS